MVRSSQGNSLFTTPNFPVLPPPIAWLHAHGGQAYPVEVTGHLLPHHQGLARSMGEAQESHLGTRSIFPASTPVGFRPLLPLFVRRRGTGIPLPRDVGLRAQLLSLGKELGVVRAAR